MKCDGCLHLESERDGAIKAAQEESRKVTALELQVERLTKDRDQWMEIASTNGKQADATLLQYNELKDAAKRLKDDFHDLATKESQQALDLKESNRLVGLWREYATFLGVEVGNLELFADTHGWNCSEATIAKGRELRAKLGVDDNWQLIEKQTDPARDAWDARTDDPKDVEKRICEGDGHLCISMEDVPCSICGRVSGNALGVDGMTKKSEEIKLWDDEIRRLIRDGKPLPHPLAYKLMLQYDTGASMRQQMADEREKYYEFMHKTADFLKGLVKPHGLPKWWDEMRETLEEGGEDCCHFDD